MTRAAESPLRRALFRALHDPVTGLANRALLLDRLTQALARSGRRPGFVAVLFLDLDRFKLVNDSLGHAAGDELLGEVARRLEGAVRSTDSVARLGGDEFVVLADTVDGADEALALAERLRDVLAAPYRLAGGERVVVTASAGVALGGAGSAVPGELLWDADAAMYKAKELGRDRTHLFEAGLRAAANDRFRAEVLLRRALDHDGLRLHYQPIVAVGTGAVVGVEALVRLHDPARGLVPPAEFIPVAEESGLIVPLGAWVIAEAARRAAHWRHLPGAGEGFCVSVNLSGRQLAHPGFLEEVADALDGTGADASALCFELTENALVDATGASLRSLEGLKRRGARLAIDDFGTGHSSLTWLRRLPADVLKVDRSFVAGLATDPDDAAIVRAVVGLGHALGLLTVAEGVETPAQLDALAALGCDWAQGYLFARPAPACAITDLLSGEEAAVGA